jgi:uncharacterized protein with PIN domain
MIVDAPNATGELLLFKGADFPKTDVPSTL